MAESGQPLLPAPAWQAITQTTQPRDSQWQVTDRRYLSEGSMALLPETTREVAPPSSCRHRLPMLTAHGGQLLHHAAGRHPTLRGGAGDALCLVELRERSHRPEPFTAGWHLR